MDLTHEDVLQILKIMEESDYEQLHLEVGDLKLIVNKRAPSQGRQGVSAPIRSEVQTRIEKALPVDRPEGKNLLKEEEYTPDVTGELDGLIPIRAPVLGTFYRSPKPGDPPFVETGQIVEEDAKVCIIEVMKLFSTIHAGVRGRISRICAEDGQLVEYNQVLFLVEPDTDNGEH